MTADTDVKWRNLARAVKDGLFPERVTIKRFNEIAERESAKGRPLPTAQELKDRWENWRQVCEELGFKQPSGRRQSATRAHCIQSIQRCARNLKTNVIRRSDYPAWQKDHPDAATQAVILEHFRHNWDRACQAAGVRAARQIRYPGHEAALEMIREVKARAEDEGLEVSARVFDRFRSRGASSVCEGAIAAHYPGGWAAAKNDALEEPVAA